MTHDEFIALIRDTAESRSIAPATLCRQAVGNTRLYRTLRNGGTCTLAVVERVRDYIESTK